MNFLRWYVLVFLLAVSSIAWMVGVAPSPEKLVLGQWQETRWIYESQCTSGGGLKDTGHGATAGHNLLGRDLIIHKAETWIFEPGGKLLIQLPEKELCGSWCLKGRGNILEIRYDDQFVEHYQITRIRKDSMVLHFDAAMQAKGIAQLTFTKTQTCP